MRVVKLRGTGETVGRNMLSLIPGEDVPYRAEIAPVGTQPYRASIADAVARVRLIDSEGAPFVLVGYSLGAAAAGDAAAGGLKYCRGVVLLADPLRVRGVCANGGVPQSRHGIAGERPVPGRVWSFSIPDDPISACPGDNGMRLIADRVTGRRQPPPVQWWNAGYTLDWINRYLGTRHTAYGIEPMPGDRRTYVQAARDVVAGIR